LNRSIELLVVQFSAGEGISKDKKKVIVGMILVFEDLGIPKNPITVIINEIPKTN
jgi:phenylpyruvate tautomerase PptA (4-oxalocrotonate tautomerase family)